jgi:type IV secretory pathway VirB6-like protein
MNFLSGIARFLFWVLVVYWVVALVRRVMGWMLRNAAASLSRGADKFGGSQDIGVPRRLVRDSMCGTHVAEEVSISLREGGELVHFCSAACRDAYAGRARKMAANG